MFAHSQAERILKELDYDFAGFTLDDFLRFVGRRKGREIISMPVPREQVPKGMFGCWVSDGEEPKEYIFYRDDLPPIHQVHIQLHELAHFLLGHPTLKLTREVLAQVAAEKAALPLDDVTKLRAKTREQTEAETETLASLIQERVARQSGMAQLTGHLSSEQNFADFLKTMRLT